MPCLGGQPALDLSGHHLLTYLPIYLPCSPGDLLCEQQKLRSLGCGAAPTSREWTCKSPWSSTSSPLSPSTPPQIPTPLGPPSRWKVQISETKAIPSSSISSCWARSSGCSALTWGVLPVVCRTPTHTPKKPKGRPTSWGTVGQWRGPWGESPLSQ